MSQEAVQEEEAQNTEDCEPCRLATGVGLALNVCETVLKESGTDCEALHRDYDEGKIDENQLFDRLITAVQDIKMDLEEIKRLANGGETDEPREPEPTA